MILLVASLAMTFAVGIVCHALGYEEGYNDALKHHER